MAVDKHNELKKDDYYINNVLSNKGEMNIPFGPIVFSK